MVKIMEEIGELANGINKGRKEQIIDSVGDVYVVLVILCMQLGLEDTVEDYINKLTDIFREVRRVLKDDATLWLNRGDSYAGSTKGRKKDGQHSNEASKSGDYYNTFNDRLQYKKSPDIRTKI